MKNGEEKAKEILKGCYQIETPKKVKLIQEIIDLGLKDGLTDTGIANEICDVLGIEKRDNRQYIATLI